MMRTIYLPFRILILILEKLSNIFKKARKLYTTDDGKQEYETIYKGKKVKFICSENSSQVVVNTVIVN